LDPSAVAALLTSGRVRDALALARQGASAHPRDATWQHLLGASLHANGESEAAVASLREAVRIAPADPVPWNTLGAVLVESGEPEAGESALSEALRLQPGYPEALFNLALARKQRGEFESAKAVLAELTRSSPQLVAAQFELANVLVANDEASAALPIFESLLARFPGDTQLLTSAAAAHQRLGHDEAAGDLCDRALADPRIAPREIATIAHTLASLGRVEDAKGAAERAVSMAPQSVEVRCLAGEALAHAGDPLGAVRHFDAAIARRPRAPSVLQKIGLASLAAGDWARAAQAFEDQRRIAPRERTPLHNLGVALTELGRRDDAVRVFREALDAGHRDAAVLSALVQLKGLVCDWDGLDALTRELREIALIPSREPAQPQASLYITGVSAAEQRAWAENWARATFGKIAPLPQRAARPSDRLRIGYLSADFYDHATSLLMAGMLEERDSARFEVFAYSTGRDDGSAIRARLVRAVDRFVDLREVPARMAARRIADDALDVLVDLGGYVKGSAMEILAYRPAPLQGHFLGYPGTTGAAFVDFFVADGVTVPPGSEAGFTERVLRMPACYQPNDPRRVLPAPRTRSELGLPEDALVLCSFNQGLKLRPPVFEAWCRLLEALPGALLWISDNGDSANARLRAFARDRGIDPARIVFASYVPQADHISRLAVADIALDTFPCSSHTTASDALWAGVPLVTTYGETFASRVAASILTAAGCADWAFHDAAKAFDATLALARDRELRGAARGRLERVRSSRLFDAAVFARDFENLLEAPARESRP
jgi:predicted O-linked N-acetylglucosamine transferase (SPINDLY family)